MKSLAVLAIFLAPSSVLASDVVESVPTQFIGEWNSKLSDCGTGDNDSHLRISSNRIAYYESEGPIKAIVAYGRYEIALISELSGEGQTWVATAQFKLSPGLDKLIDSTSTPGQDFIRYRCASSKR